jgi:hypothetical protein
MSGNRNGRGTKLSDIYKDKEEVAAYLKKFPNATLGDVAMCCNMSKEQAEKYCHFRGKKAVRQANILKMLPATSQEIEVKLGLKRNAVLYALNCLRKEGKIESSKVWREVRCQVK